MAPNERNGSLNVEISEDHVKTYQKDGFVVLKNFLTPEEVKDAMGEICQLTRKGIEELKGQKVKVFESQGSQYHMDSQDKSFLFFEQGALDESGNLLVDQMRAVHKIGHAAHNYGPVAKSIVFSEKMKEAIKKITEQSNPVLTQSMYLVKQPKIGGKREIHQDESYLRTEPNGHVFGVWIALDDATLENGCLDFIPGSHTDPRFNPLTRFHERQPGGPKDGLICVYTGDAPYLHDDLKDEFVRVPMKSGDVVILHGLTVHKSEANKSGNPRAAFTFHCYNKISSVDWIPSNMWLESEGRVFPPLY